MCSSEARRSSSYFFSSPAARTTSPQRSSSFFRKAGKFAGEAIGSVSEPIFANVTAGVFAVVLPDATQTYPIDIGFDVSVTLPPGGAKSVLYYPGVTPQGGVLFFDEYEATLPGLLCLRQ